MSDGLRVADATRTYGTGESAVRALDCVSVSLAPGDTIAVMGPSGSGKSTLFAVMGLIESLDTGQVSVDDNRVDNLSEDARAHIRRDQIGLVFQAYHLVPALTAAENVCLPLVPYVSRSQLREKAISLLERIGLGHRAAHRPYQLSGGEQQRVAVARALMNDPDYVLADEPTGNLDSRSASLVIDLLLDLQRQLGFGLAIATHDAGVASRLSRRIELADGRVVTAA